jgi:hypothetical protein
MEVSRRWRFNAAKGTGAALTARVTTALMVPLLAGGWTVGLLAPTHAAAQDSDLVILRSGNPVVGEVQSLRRGTLSFDTPEMDVVGIDWEDIAFVTSPLFFEVETSGGERYFGSLASADTAVLIVVGDQRADTLDFREVVEIGSIETSFFARTSGFVDLGANLAKANSLASLLVGGRFAYRGPKWGFEVNGDTYVQTQESVDTAGNTFEQRTSRASAQTTLNRFLSARWVASASGKFETNEELSLDSRFLGVLGGQYIIVRNQGLELTAGAGGALNDEQFTGEERQTTGEVLLTATFDVFDIGDIDIFTSVDTYTNPSDGGRFRASFDGRVSWEIFEDFFLGFTTINRFDSKPPSEDASKSDFQYGVTIGWSWS